MSKFNKEFDFELSEEITYACELGEKKTVKLKFIAPSKNDKKIASKLRYLIVNNLSKQSGTQPQHEKNTDVKLNKDDLKTFVMAFIYNLPEDSADKFKELFWELMCNKKCLIDNKVAINEHLAGQINLDDEDEIIGEYIANFILPSWMKRQMMS